MDRCPEAPDMGSRGLHQRGEEQHEDPSRCGCASGAPCGGVIHGRSEKAMLTPEGNSLVLDGYVLNIREGNRLDGYHNCHHMVITIIICQHMVTLHMDNIGWLSKDDTNRTGTQLSFIFKAEWFSNFSRLGSSKLEVERFSKNAHEFGSSKF